MSQKFTNCQSVTVVSFLARSNDNDGIPQDSRSTRFANRTGADTVS